MGTDIHAWVAEVVEVNGKNIVRAVSDRLDLERNYMLFSMLSGVRNMGGRSAIFANHYGVAATDVEEHLQHCDIHNRTLIPLRDIYWTPMEIIVDICPNYGPLTAQQWKKKKHKAKLSKARRICKQGYKHDWFPMLVEDKRGGLSIAPRYARVLYEGVKNDGSCIVQRYWPLKVLIDQTYACHKDLQTDLYLYCHYDS